MPGNNQAGPLPSGYALTSQLRKGLRYFFSEQLMVGFAGGLNLRDAPTELAANESPDCWNVTLDERGGVVKRPGYAKWNASAVANLIQDGYHSIVAGKLLWYSPADGVLYSDPGTGVLTSRHTFTAGSRISLVDYVGKVYAAHPVDGLFSSSDGVTWTLVSKGSHTNAIPVGSLLVVWQNKLWIAGDPAHPLRLYFCAPGDATDWDTADGGGSVDVREKDDTPIVALHGGSGFDFQTKPGLWVFKEDSTYRVSDSSTGQYATIDGAVGAASKNAVTELYGEIVLVGRRGIYMSKKLAALVPAAEKVLPLFDPSSLDDTKMANWCVGYKGDRVFVSVTRQSASTNDLALEFAPLYGWVTAGSNAAGVYVTKRGDAAETLIGASPSVTGQLYNMQSGGSDDGAAIQSWFVSRWFQVLNGHEARMNLLRLLGRGTFKVTVRTNFENTGGWAETFTVGTNTGMVWGTGVWGAGEWGGYAVEDYAQGHPRSIGRAFQIRIDDSSTATFSTPAILESGASLGSGAWALYALDSQYAPLGLS